MTLKLNRANHIRDQAEFLIDQHYAQEINKEIGPLGSLHVLKRIQAQISVSSLVYDVEDQKAILKKASEQDERLSELDRKRRDIKKRIREAPTSEAIKNILEQLGLSIEGNRR